MWMTSVHSAYQMLVPKLSNSSEPLIVKESSLHLHQVVIYKSPSQYCWGQKWALRLLCFCIWPLWHPFNLIKLPNRKQKSHNYPHWHNRFKVCNPGLVLCIGRNKFGGRECKSSASLSEHTDTKLLQKWHENIAIANAPLLVALFEWQLISYLTLLI
jgi:hypothetical protein